MSSSCINRSAGHVCWLWAIGCVSIPENRFQTAGQAWQTLFFSAGDAKGYRRNSPEIRCAARSGARNHDDRCCLDGLNASPSALFRSTIPPSRHCWLNILKQEPVSHRADLYPHFKAWRGQSDENRKGRHHDRPPFLAANVMLDYRERVLAHSPARSARWSLPISARGMSISTASNWRYLDFASANALPGTLSTASAALALKQAPNGVAISLCAGEEIAYLRDIEKLIRITLPREDRRTPGHRDTAPAIPLTGRRNVPGNRVHPARGHDAFRRARARPLAITAVPVMALMALTRPMARTDSSPRATCVSKSAWRRQVNRMPGNCSARFIAVTEY